MKIFALCLLAVGALLVYGATPILRRFYSKEFGEKEIATVKTIGLLIALAGAIIIFVI